MYRRSFRSSLCFLIPVALTGVILCETLTKVAKAQDTWTNPSGGFFDLAANWADGSAPGLGESALFDLNAIYDVSWDNTTGNTTNLGLTVDAGDVRFLSLGGTWAHTLTGNSTINGGRLEIEELILNVNGDFEVNQSGNLTVGFGGELNVDGLFDINGEMNILSGSVVNSLNPSAGIVGTDISVTDTATVNLGEASRWNVDGLNVGAFQNSIVNLETGSEIHALRGVTIGGSGSAINPFSGTGQMNLDGGSRMDVGETLTVGSFLSGTLNISGGSVVTSAASDVGGGSQNSTVLVSGAGSRFDTSGLLEVGVPRIAAGNGMIRVEDGGVMTSGSAFLTEAAVVITGEDSRWTNSGRLDFGNAAENNLNQFIRVQNGGTLESDEIFVLKNTWLRAEDADSSIATTGDVYVGGSDGRGLLTVQDNASVNIGGRLLVGAVGGSGDVQLFGGGATLNASQIEVGSTGYLALLDGSQVTTQELRLTGQLGLQQGTINVTGADSVLTIDQSNLSALDPFLELDDSTLNVAGQTVFGAGTNVLVENSANFTSTSVINDGTISVTNSATMGSSARHDGYGGNGTLNVGTASVTLHDAGLADLGRVTNINGGVLNASNGFSIGAGDAIIGNGQINGRVSGGGGSAIYASGGDLTIGDSAHVAGFSSSGELHTLSNAITILDDNQARLGSYTQLGDSSGSGYLQIDNGAVINFGDNLVGYGTIDNDNFLATALINNGTMQGNSATDRLIVEGFVKGVGTFDNVQFNGTFSPGLSPTITRGNNFFFGPTSVLEMEIGGLIPGDEHDAIWAEGLLSLDGTLDVVLINGFAPELGDSFDLFNWGSIEGSFHTFDLPTLNADLRWDTSQLYSTGVLSISSVPEPSASVLIGLLLVGNLIRRRRSV